MYNIYYYHSNGIIPFKIPSRIINGNKLKESGKIIDIILFGKEVNAINIKQAFYLLNEKNYEKGILEFKKGFNELKNCDLELKGEFSNFNAIKYSKYYGVNNHFYISTSKSNDLILMDAYTDNDTL